MEVAPHLGLDWKTVKAMDQKFLEGDYGKSAHQGLRILAIDEVSIRRGQRYLTVVLDYESGRVVWVGQERKARTLGRFFAGMTTKQGKQLEAMVMDMWAPYILAIGTEVPHLKIVFVDKVRNSEYRKAPKANKQVFKGTKYLLLKTAGIALSLKRGSSWENCSS